MNGFVPMIHNADIPIKETIKKFSLKKKVQCRVKDFFDKNDLKKKEFFFRFYKLIHHVND